METTIKTKDLHGNPFKIYISTVGCGHEPYFSVTANGYYKTSLGHVRWDRGGTLHDEILLYFPKLKPLINLHLCDLNGVPMHAIENGLYWVGKVIGLNQKYGPNEHTVEKCLEFFKNICMVDDEHVSSIIERLEMVHNPSCEDPEREVRNKWKEIVDNELRPIWKKKADDALKMIEELEKGNDELLKF